MTFCSGTVRDVFTSVPITTYVVAAVWIGATIYQAVLMKQKKIYTGGQKKIDAAEEAGRVVYADLERIVHKGHRSESNYYRYRGIYTYTVNGVQYRKGLTKESKNFMTPIKLYYVSNPAHAKTAGEMRRWSEQVLPRIVPLLMALLTYILLS